MVCSEMAVGVTKATCVLSKYGKDDVARCAGTDNVAKCAVSALIARRISVCAGARIV
jgi:hypothetical protein